MSKKYYKLKSVIATLLAVVIVIGMLPTMSVFAAQSNEYVDPADSWLSANNRTNELDVNATTTYETQYCCVCRKDTSVLTYRVPEYTKSGETALNRNVRYSDGTCINGRDKGNLDDGTPGINAYYSGYHFTKSVCQTCGTINSGEGEDVYCFNKNVYSLNSCDHNFFLDFDNTTYEKYDDNYHITTLKKGEYCKFCKGTFARATIGKERHNFNESIDGQIGNNRFYVKEVCEDCNYETSEYVTAKSVVSSYYGNVDGDAHTLTVSDLSSSGVKTSIRYGTSADNCNKTSAPNYTEAGYYPVYYKIDYIYGGNVITENGVSYVWLLEEQKDNTIVILPSQPEKHSHDFRYVETVAPSCENLGYELWQCMGDDGCGQLEKRNYRQATGHKYKATTIREATCTQGGLKLHICTDCGDFYEETTPLVKHNYKAHKHNPTCISAGYTEHICEECNDTYITDITPTVSHAYEIIVKAPTCVDKGYTTHICTTCNFTMVTDYTEPIGHEWDDGHTVTSPTCEGDGVIEFNCKNCDEKMIQAENAKGHTPGAAATCTEPQVCEDCGAILELPTGHQYHSEVTETTCTEHGYTTYTCKNCPESYVADYTDVLPHDYNAVTTNPTCTKMGYTTYTCKNCGDEYISDYTEKLPHNYDAVVTVPTCTSLGFTTYTCVDCGDTYKADYVDMTEHNYSKQTVEPTCTEHGYAIYTCPDCGKSYIGDYTDEKEHHYTETIIAPTCNQMGYSIFKCTDCDDEYKGNYTDKIAHDYESVITPPTCTAFGFTTFTCKNCGHSYVADLTDKTEHNYNKVVTEPTCLELGYTTYTCDDCGNTYKSNFVEALGHNPTEWVVDTPATIENGGEKHIECERCGEILKTAEIAQLIATDRTDEDGKAEVGEFTIKLSDELNIPIFNSVISIDKDNNVSIALPNGKLLDFSDRTFIKAYYTSDNSPASEINIFISDSNKNKATGKTDAEGMLIVPNNTTSTTDDNGTIGKTEDDIKKTFVVTVTDKANVVIDNCTVYLGESNNVVVDLPDGIKPTSEYPVIITITDQNGVAQKDVSVITLGESDYIEKGITDMYGKITLPTAYEGYTDSDGKVNVTEYYVFVADETKAIENAFVKINDDESISVTLPDGVLIDYANRITITVMNKKGEALKDFSVSVTDVTEKSLSDFTDENGKIVVPPTNEDITDENGDATVNGHNVNVVDENGNKIENSFITIDDTDKIKVELPENIKIDIANRIIVTVTDKGGNPEKALVVEVTDKDGKTESNLTDENGKAIVPHTNIDYTDVNGYGELDGYSVTVKNADGNIEGAYLELDRESGKITVTLPQNIKIDDYNNRVTVKVVNKADNTPAKGVEITVNETVSEGEQKTANGKTDSNGICTVPPLSEDITDGDGKSDVTEEITKDGEDTDDDGEKDTPDEIVTTSYSIIVKDTKGIISNALVKIEDGKVFVTLPDTHTLTSSNQTTVTVLDKDAKCVKDVSVTVTDKNNQTATKTTDANGQVVVPNKPSSGGSSSGGSSGGGGGYSISTNTTNVTVTDKDGKTVSVSKSTDSKGNVTITLPTGKTLVDSNWYTIKTTDRNGKVKADVEVTLKEKNKAEAKGVTDKNGVLILPGIEHKAYIFGYDDGTFRPDNDMSRAEAAAIFARLISEEKGETISGKSKFIDVRSNEWYADYVGYLAKYDIIKGYTDNTFRPDAPVTRAEFVTMAVRYYALFNDVKNVGYTVNYTDVLANYWAYNNIAYAKNIGWLNGYADGTFKGDNNITRAEVVTVVNRATDRNADENYINKNLSILNKFTDLTIGKHWADAEVFEAANTHRAVNNSNGETWVKKG